MHSTDQRTEEEEKRLWLKLDSNLNGRAGNRI